MASSEIFEEQTEKNRGSSTAIRESNFEWKELYMAVALTASLRSKDPNTRVGCCIVNPKTYTIIVTAYNGFPPGLEDTEEKWEKEEKKNYVLHAETNAVILSRSSVEGAICFVTLFPCKECAKALSQAGIKEVIYLSYPWNSENPSKYEMSREIFKAGRVTITPFEKDEEKQRRFVENFKSEIDITMKGLKKKEQGKEEAPMSTWPGFEKEKDCVTAKRFPYKRSPYKSPTNSYQNQQLSPEKENEIDASSSLSSNIESAKKRVKFDDKKETHDDGGET